MFGCSYDAVTQCVITGIFTLLGALVGAVVVCKMADRSRRKTATCVAKAIMKAMNAEIAIGISVLEAYINGEQGKGFMPTKCWESYTLSTDLLEAILRKTQGTRSKASFQPADFLVHLKNYYSNICGNVNTSISANLSPSSAHVALLQSAKDVLAMVDDILAIL